MEVSPLAPLFARLAGWFQLGVVLAIALHTLALVPQWRAQYFNPRFLQLTLYGLVLAVAHGAVIALAASELARGNGGSAAALALWCLGAALLLNLAVAAQNFLAVVALVRLHRPSAVVAHGMRRAVQPMLWASGLLAVAAVGALMGWF